MALRRAQVVVFSTLSLSVMESCQPPPEVIVQNGPETRTRFADDPITVIGMVEGVDDYVLDALAGAARLEDGSVVAALLRSSQVRRYDPSGNLQWSVGRQGEGPGEYEYLSIPKGCVGENIIRVYDRMHRRITVLNSENGSVMDTWRMRQAAFELACSPNGIVVLTGNGEESSIPGPYRPPQPLYIWQGGEANPRLLRRRVPGGDRWMYMEQGAQTSMLRPWGRRIRVAVANDGVWLSTGDTFEVEFLDWKGKTTHVVRWPGPDLAVSQEDVATYRDQYVSSRLNDGDSPARIQEVENLWRGWEEQLPESFPSVSDMVLPRAGGGVWVQHYIRPRDTSATWAYLDDSGNWKRVLNIPKNMRLMDIGQNWALVRVRDHLDRDVLHVYELIEAN